MPAFGTFAKRLAQLNDPAQRRAAQTPMDVGAGIPQPRNLPNPMQGGGDRPMGETGAIPLVQDNTQPPPTSGTGQPKTQKPLDSIRAKVAAEARPEDLAPKLEDVPDIPAFQPKEVHGIGGHLKAAFMAAGGASRMYPGQPLAPLIGAVMGGIKPEIAQHMDYEGRIVPDAARKQQTVMARNDQRQKSYGMELKNRELAAKIKKESEPQYKPLAGAEYPVLYDPSDPSKTVIPKGPDGQPIRNASTVNAETRAESSEAVALQKRLADAEKNADKATHDFEIAKMKYEQNKELADLKAKHQAEIEGIRQAGANKRNATTVGGANARADKAEAGKDKRAKLRYGGDEEDSGSRTPNPAGAFGIPRYGANDFNLSPLDQQINKVHAANQAKRARKQAPPPAQ